MKKHIFLFSMLLFCGIKLFSQGNSCEMFLNAYNSSNKGFDVFRPGSSDTAKNFTADTALVRKYELDHIYLFKSASAIPSKYDSTMEYYSWSLIAGTKRISTGNKEYEEVSAQFEPWFDNVISNLGAGCLQGLNHTAVFKSTYGRDSRKLISYFYPKQITLAPDLNEDEIKKKLAEYPHIIVSLSTPFIGTGVFVEYSFQGFQHRKK